ncbi:MAG: hypothetical protein ABI675_15105 [Chitinophagaceae bacterium]
MIREEAIVILLPVSRIGEKVYFQKSLPGDTRRIIGLEYGVTAVSGDAIALPVVTPSPFQVIADKIIGRLTLQIPGREGIFFRGDLMEERNFHVNDGLTDITWTAQVWSHGGNKEEIELSVDSNTDFIEGFFSDSYGKDEFESLTYQLHLYLWIEKCIT